MVVFLKLRTYTEARTKIVRGFIGLFKVYFVSYATYGGGESTGRSRRTVFYGIYLIVSGTLLGTKYNHEAKTRAEKIVFVRFTVLLIYSDCLCTFGSSTPISATDDASSLAGIVSGRAFGTFIPIVF